MVNSSHTPRRHITQLPVELQTDAMSKYFASTVDQVFQPGKPERLSGYIGSKPSYYDSARDFYISEITNEREANQLEPGLISRDSDNNINALLVYDDYVKYLGLQGANITDHNRLFSSDCYSWAPPVDPDKICNYQQYYWFGADVTILPGVELTAQTTNYVGDGINKTFLLPESFSQFDSSLERVVAFVDQQPISQFSRPSSNELSFYVAPNAGAEIILFRYGDLTQIVSGKQGFDPSPFTSQPVSALTSTMKIILSDARTLYSGWAKQPWSAVILHDQKGMWEYPSWDTVAYDLGFTDAPWGSREAYTTFWVDGVGAEIVLTPIIQNDDPTSKTIYVTIDRRSNDGNPWSLHNYWVHSEAFAWSGQSFQSLRARRPIIEFIPNLELYKYGTRRLDDITAVLTGEPYRTAQNFAPRPVNDSVRWWDVLEWDVNADGGFEASALQQIPLAQTNGSPLGSIFTDGQHSLVFGDRVLVVKNDNSALNNRIITVVKSDTGDMLFQASPTPSVGDIVRIRRAIKPWGDQFAIEPWDASIIPEEYYFDGTTWLEAPARSFTTDPLFSLYTASRVRHENLPLSTFTGNRLFGYADGVGTADAVLNRPLAYDNNGEIQFNNDIAITRSKSNGVDIPGLQFFRIVGETTTSDIYGNDWYAYPVKTSQAKDQNGIWELPLNLTANPGNMNVGLITKAQWFPHLSDGIKAQAGLSGVPYGTNNWRDTARILGRGATILQHESPMLKSMLLAAKKPFDYFDAARFVEHEYTRFRAKFVQQLSIMLNSGSLRTTDDPGKWVEAVLTKLKSAKSNTSPFALSQMAGGGYYIPQTPASLGLFPSTKPEYVIDYTYSSPVAFIVGHDGSRTPAFMDWRDAVILSLEVMIYNNIEKSFLEDSSPTFDWWSSTGGRYRNKGSSTHYTAQELIDMYRSMFVLWVQKNQLDYTTNSGFNVSDPFTYNFNGSLDIDGNVCPGNWRAIYRYFFDTDHPHTHPWEMLGFSSQPSWWTSEYGDAPFTSGNLRLWHDLRDGRIRQGGRAGVDSRFARPDLMSIIPVDDSGILLNPIDCGIIRQTTTRHSADWVIGDHGPVENLWMNTPSYAFAKAQLAYLMRPAAWTEFAWDRGELTYINEQWLWSDTQDRTQPSKITVHGEVIDGTTVVKTGVQCWIADMMISRSQSPSILGAAMRGISSSLVHRMGGFTQSSNLSVLADNFGILPSEDISVVFYQPPPTRQTFYSAMIIEWTGAGWRVIGYDVETQAFQIIPGDTYGPKTTINLGNAVTIHDWKPNVYYSVGIKVVYNNTVYQCATANTSSSKFETTYWTNTNTVAPTPIRVSVCDKGLNNATSIPYGTVFATYQDIASFVRDYFRYLVKEGFNFEEPDSNGNINGWYETILQFLQWSQINWQAGNFIAISPGASSLSFKTEVGTIYNVEQPMNGVYGLLDRTARPILHNDAFVSRIGGEVKILVNNGDLYGARLQIGEIEHALVFSNTTIFGDVIYSPLLNLYQPRLKINGIRSTDWNGRMEAPGYVISDGNLLENFQKTTEDLREMFDIEQADVPYLRNFARHNIAFQPLTYLQNLLIAETEQFEFYQGMIQQKGASGVFSALSRSKFVDQTSDLQFLEEWALELGSYGAVNKTSNLSFAITTDDISHDRQLITIGETHNDDGVIGLASSDSRWIKKPDTATPFRMLSTGTQKLSGAGNVRLDEVNFTIRTVNDFTSLYVLIQQNGYFGDGSTVWVYDRGDGSYDVKQAFSIGGSSILVSNIETSTEDTSLSISTIRITFSTPHGLSSVDNGSSIYLPSTSSYTSPDFGGFNTLYVETTRTILISVPPLDVTELTGYSFSSPATFPMYIMRSVRFADIRTAQSFWEYHFPATGQMMWVDTTSIGAAVYKWTASGWKVVRQQPKKVDSSFIEMVRLYMNAPTIDSSASSLTENPIILPGMTIYHPLAGLLPGSATNEIEYISDFDPAQYYDTGAMWGKSQVGDLWWDTSAVKFLETEIDVLNSNDPTRNQASLDYRVNYWGKIAPGTSVNIYEWTRVLSWPMDSLITTSGSFIQSVEYDATINGYLSVYYTWVLNPTLVPEIPARSISASSVAAMISDPSSSGLPWMSPITANSFVVSGISSYIGSPSTAMEIYLSAPENTGVTHRQWQLSRPGDEFLIPDHSFWKALRSSLVGFDDSMEAVPNSALISKAKLGVGPGQSMWPSSERLDARRAFVSVVNEIFGSSYLASTNKSLASQMALTTPTFQNLIWERADSFSGLVLPPLNSYDFIASSIKEREYISKQTQLFNTRSMAALNRPPRILLKKFNDGEASWSIWDVASTGELSLATNYDVETPSYATMISAKYTAGTRILVNNDENASGFWVIYAYLPGYIGANTDGFVPLCIQTYDTSDFFSEVDWYADGFSASNPPVISYATTKDRDASQGTEVSDEFVKINDNGSGNWIWTQWSGTQWDIVAVNNGTLALSANFYDSSRTAWGANYFDPAKVSVRDGSMELRILFDVIHANITPAQMNKIYYTMLNFVFAHQNEVPWAFKTSFLTIAKYQERLAATPIETQDNIDNLLAFVDDVKPYRVKVRDYIQSFMTDIDVSNVRAADYDKPAYYDAKLGVYRPLDPSRAIDLAILTSSKSWKDWASLYLNSGYDPSTASYNPIRRIKTTMRFDRIDPGYTPLQNNYGWDETAMDAFPFDDIVSEINASSSALNRMLHYYEPGLGMRAADAAIDFDLGFKGLVVSGPVVGEMVDANLINGSNVSFNTIPEKFADPTIAAGHPQEFATFRAPDSLSMTVHSNWSIGAPCQRSDYMDVSNSGTTVLELSQVPASKQSVLVFLDGALIPDGEVAYSQKSISAQTTGDNLLLAHSFGAGDASSFVNTIRQSLPYTSMRSWVLENPSSGVRGAEHFGTLVFVNGLALSPHTTRCFVSPAASGVSFVDVSDASLIRVWLNGSLYSGVVGSGDEPDFILEDGYFKLNNPSIVGEICVEYAGDGDFIVGDGRLTITKAISSSDDIEVITFVNGDLMGISSQAFGGAYSGCYPIMVDLPIKALDYLIVSVDGEVATPNVDYIVTTAPPLNFDEVEMDFYPFDQKVGFNTIQFHAGHRSSQKILITAFSGDPARPASTWSSETIETGLAIMADHNVVGDWDNLPFDVQYDGMADQYAESTLGDRQIFLMNGTWEFNQLDKKSGTLVNPLMETDTEVMISLDDASNPFAIPENDMPGSAMVNGERIEYFEMSISGNSVILSQLRRGAKNTRVGAEQRSFARYVGDGTVRSFDLAKASAISGVEVIVHSSTTFEYLTQNRHFTVTQNGNDIRVLLENPPKQGEVITIAQTQSIQHIAGSQIFALTPGDRTALMPFRGAYDFAA